MGVKVILYPISHCPVVRLLRPPDPWNTKEAQSEATFVMADSLVPLLPSLLFVVCVVILCVCVCVCVCVSNNNNKLFI